MYFIGFEPCPDQDVGIDLRSFGFTKSGGWFEPPPLGKMMEFVHWDDDIPNIPNVPNVHNWDDYAQYFQYFPIMSQYSQYYSQYSWEHAKNGNQTTKQ